MASRQSEKAVRSALAREGPVRACVAWAVGKGRAMHAARGSSVAELDSHVAMSWRMHDEHIGLGEHGTLRPARIG